MAQHITLMVPGGEPDGRPVTITAPFDGSVIATIETAGLDAAQTALDTAHGLFRNRDAWISATRRIDILRSEERSVGKECRSRR